MAYSIRVATLEDREALEKWANGPGVPKIAKEFPFIWRRNQSWETELNRPSIALNIGPEFCGSCDHGVVGAGVCRSCGGAGYERQIIGFHATTFTKMGYANLYYVVVGNDWKGQRVGKRLIEDAIKRAKAAGMSRWTNKSHHNPKDPADDNGENFFSNHLGIQPVGLQTGQVVYDWSLKDVTTCEDISAAAAAGTLLRPEEIPDRKLKQYARYLDRELISTMRYCSCTSSIVVNTGGYEVCSMCKLLIPPSRLGINGTSSKKRHPHRNQTQ